LDGQSPFMIIPLKIQHIFKQYIIKYWAIHR
jgi:hypothetical protein